MLRFLLVLALLNSLAQAKETQELSPLVIQETQELEFLDDPKELPEAASRLRMREVREFVRTLDPATTCMDEYVQRRRQLVRGLVFTPISGAVTIAASTFGGGFLGATFGKFDTRFDGWAQLGWVIGGLLAGGVASGVYVIADTTSDSVQLHQIQTTAKALMEIKQGLPFLSTSRLYTAVLKRQPELNVSIEEFAQALEQLDQSGSLCDGSLVKVPRLALRRNHLKHKVARFKHIARALEVSPAL